MDVTELTAYVREQAGIADASTEWSAVKILQLLNQTRTDVFEPLITAAKCGYWVHTLTRVLGAANPVVRLPLRAAALLHCDIRVGTGLWAPLTEYTEAEQQDWERMGGNQPNCPLGYVVRGSTLNLVPSAVDNNYSLRVKIVVRPSKLYLPQAAGIVTNIDLTTNIITLTSMPLDMITSTTLAGTLNIDVIEPVDNYELSLFHAQATVLDATHVQIAAGYSLLKVQVGDYLRAANQSDWPQLPEPFHPSLASATAIIPCTQRDLYDRANDLRQSTASSITRLVDHLKPRSKTQTQERRPIQHSWE